MKYKVALQIIPIRILITFFLFFQFNTVNGQQVYSLYYSQQTGQSSMYRGSADKTTDKTESGIAILKMSGPISATVTPELKINTSETRKWDGKISVDGTKAPETGKSIDALMDAEYTITYSKPKGRGQLGSDEKITGSIDYGDNGDDDSKRGIHDVVQRKGKVTIPFKVYSIDLKFGNIPAEVCPNKPFIISTIPYPLTGGKVVWNDGYEGATRTMSVKSDTTIFATYEIEGVTFKIRTKIKVGNINKWEIASTSQASPTSIEMETPLRELINRLPGSESFLIDGPYVTKKVYSRACCSADSSKSKAVEEKVSGKISFNIKATNIELLDRPYSGSFSRRINRYGYSFVITGSYKTIMNYNGSIEGNYDQIISSCSGTVPCNKELAEFNLPLRMKVTTNCSARIVNYKNKIKTNIPCVANPVDLFPMIKGKISLNQFNCNEGLRYRVGTSEAVANMKVSAGAYILSFPLTISPAFDLIRNY